MAIRDHEPIAAIATAPGRGGIGVVRISFGGKDAHAVNALMTALFGQRLIPRHASYVPFLDANGEALDRGIGLYFQACVRRYKSAALENTGQCPDPALRHWRPERVHRKRGAELSVVQTAPSSARSPHAHPCRRTKSGRPQSRLVRARSQSRQWVHDP